MDRPKKDIKRFRFYFLNFDLEYLRRVQSSELQNTKSLQAPASSAHGLYRILCSYWLAHFYVMKKKYAKEFHGFGLDCRMLEFLQIFFSQATIVDFPSFSRPVWRKRFRFVYIQPFCRIRGILVWSGSKLWTLFKYSKLKLKNQKNLQRLTSLSMIPDLRLIQFWPDATFNYIFFFFNYLLSPIGGPT